MPLDATNFDQQDWRIPLLLQAKQIIRERGWCQGATYSAGRVCMLSAVRSAGYLRNWGDLGIPWPVQWQDAPGRTVEEVYAWFDEQIALLSAERRQGAAQTCPQSASRDR